MVLHQNQDDQLFSDMQTFNIADVGDVAIKKSKKAKRIILKINQAGEPIITIPYYVPYSAGKLFASQQVEWLKKHTSKVEPVVLKNNGLVGRHHKFKFTIHDSDTVISRVNQDTIMVKYPPEISWYDDKVQKEAIKAATRALKRQAEAFLPSRLHVLAKQHGYKYKSVSVKAMRSRWGSCSSLGTINLSIWLMQVPDELIDYVLCHELTHLNHQHHQPAFWSELAEILPDYKLRRKQLRQYKPRLEIALPE